MKDLKRKTLLSLFWVGIDVFGQRVIHFIIGIILARLLMPEDYGLIGLLAIFISFSMVFVNSGFGFTLIRKKDVSETEYQTVFWFNLSISIIFFLILWLTSPLIGWFYNKPILVDLVKVLAINIIINAASSIQNVRYSRVLNFRQMTFIGIGSKLVAGVCAVFMAIYGFGVWALVFYQLLTNLLNTTLLWILGNFHIKPVFSVSVFRSLFNFSSKILYTQITGSILNNLYPTIIGKYFNVIDVGYFVKAQGLQELPVMSFLGIINKVTLPAFAKIQNDEIAFKRNYKKAIKLSVFSVGLPLMLLFLLAHPLINLLLTEKWLPAAPYLKVLALGGIFYPLNALNYNIVGIKGRADLLMYQSFFGQGIIILSIIIGWFWGVYGLVVSLSAKRFFAYLLNVYYTNKVIKYPLSEQFFDVMQTILLLIFSGIFGYLLMDFFYTDLSKLIYIGGSSTLVFISLAWVLKNDAFLELKDTIIKTIPTKNR